MFFGIWFFSQSAQTCSLLISVRPQKMQRWIFLGAFVISAFPRIPFTVCGFAVIPFLRAMLRPILLAFVASGGSHAANSNWPGGAANSLFAVYAPSHADE